MHSGNRSVRTTLAAIALVGCSGLGGGSTALALEGTLVGIEWTDGSGGEWGSYYTPAKMVVADCATGRKTIINQGTCYGPAFSPDGTKFTHNMDHVLARIHDFDNPSEYREIQCIDPNDNTWHCFSSLSDNWVLYSGWAKSYLYDMGAGTHHTLPFDHVIGFDYAPAVIVSQFSLLAPSNGETGVNVQPDFDWSDAAGSTDYRIVVATNADLSSPVIDATTAQSSYAAPSQLPYATTYYWRVTSDGTGGTQDTSVFSFVTEVNDLLLATVTVAPSPATINLSETQTFAAIALNGAGNTIDAPMTWSCSGGSVSPTDGVTTVFTPDATEQFTVTASSGTIHGTATVAVSETPSIALHEPAAGDVWYAGTARHIRWSTVNLANVSILCTVDGGSSFDNINFSIQESNASWGDWSWEIPADYPGLPSVDCMILIASYFGEYPAASGTFEIRTLVDTDGDGMDDRWESDYWGSAGENGADDWDADGVSNLDEYLLGYDPTDAASMPAAPAPPPQGENGLSCVGAPAGGSALPLLLGVAASLCCLPRRRVGTTADWCRG